MGCPIPQGKKQFKISIIEKTQFEIQFMVKKSLLVPKGSKLYSRSTLKHKLSLICFAKLFFMHTAEENFRSAQTLSQCSIKSLN